MKRNKHSIRYKLTTLLLTMTTLTMLVSATVSLWGLCSMKQLSVKSSHSLGQTAAEDAETALENLAVENLQTVAKERSGYIEEKFHEIEAYVHAIAAQAQDIYEHPESYPDREMALPVKGSTTLAAQLLWSERLAETDAEGADTMPPLTLEIRKLGNLQDMLIQYNANNDMVSSAYIATESGWMIQADYIAGSKYSGNNKLPDYYEASERQWYVRASQTGKGQRVYTDVIRDVHAGGNCIVCAEPVFLNGKLAAVVGVGSYLDTINEAVLNTSIGETGYAFLIGEEGQIIISPKEEGETSVSEQSAGDLRNSSNRNLAAIAAKVLSGEEGQEKITLDGKDVYVSYVPLADLHWGLITVLDVEEVLTPARDSQAGILTLADGVSKEQSQMIRQMLITLLLVMGVVFAVICLVGTVFSRKLTVPIHELTKEVARIDGGNLDCRIHLQTGDEVEALGTAFNKMTEQIQSYVKNLATVTAEKERIRTEIQVASKLQADMLPKAEELEGNGGRFTLAASMTPAKGVGGDFYDFFRLDEDRLAVVMADVSGKGVPAALFMVVSRTVIKSRLQHIGAEENALAEAVEHINNILCADNRNEMFVTAWIGILTLSSGILRFVNAGHCRPVICHADGTCEYETFLGGIVLAGMEEVPYRQSEIRLLRGDTILLYTDGVTEATSTEKKLYGEERLIIRAEKSNDINSEDILTPEKLLEAVWQDVSEFQEGAEQFDDITMLAIRWNGTDCAEKTETAKKENIGVFAEFLEELMKQNAFSTKSILKVQIAADELLSNICNYSNASEMTVKFRAKETQTERKVVLCFEDNGIPFNPLEVPEPDVTAVMEMREIGGLGIYLVKKGMDRIAYEYAEGKNVLKLEKAEQKQPYPSSGTSTQAQNPASG